MPARTSGTSGALFSSSSSPPPAFHLASSSSPHRAHTPTLSFLFSQTCQRSSLPLLCGFGLLVDVSGQQGPRPSRCDGSRLYHLDPRLHLVRAHRQLASPLRREVLPRYRYVLPSSIRLVHPCFTVTRRRWTLRFEAVTLKLTLFSSHRYRCAFFLLRLVHSRLVVTPL